jgi:RHS repeat-associated protein
VTSGDVVNLYGKSYYFTNGVTPVNNNLILNALTGFVGAFTGTGGIVNSFEGGAATAATAMATTNNALNTALQNALKDMPQAAGGIPQAGLNWILFDNQLNAVASNSGSLQVGIVGSGSLASLSTSVPISRSGYLYVYCSNESSNIDVYFDNLQVVNNRGPILEETHYYPFGLTIAAISSVGQNKPENKFKFNNGTELQHQEFSDGTGLQLYDASYRMFDPQLGRFNGIDIMAVTNANISPYAFVKNNPLIYSDRLGLDNSEAGFEDGDNLDPDDDASTTEGDQTAGSTGEGIQATFASDNSTNKITDPGLVYDPAKGIIYNDPNINSAADIPAGSNLVYVGSRIAVTDGNGTTTWYEATNGSMMSVYHSDPGWSSGYLPTETFIGNAWTADEKTASIAALAADSYNVPLDVAEAASKAAVEGAVKKSMTRVGLFGAILGIGTAANHLMEGNGNWHDVLAIGLGVASAALLLTPVGEAYAAAATVATIAVDAATIVNDTWSTIEAANSGKK